MQETVIAQHILDMTRPIAKDLEGPSAKLAGFVKLLCDCNGLLSTRLALAVEIELVLANWGLPAPCKPQTIADNDDSNDANDGCDDGNYHHCRNNYQHRMSVVVRPVCTTIMA